MEIIRGIQILAVLFGFFMVYLTFLHKKRKEFTMKESVVWTVFWFSFMYVALFPGSLDFLVKRTLGLQRPLDFFIIIGFMFMVFISFYIYGLVRHTQRKLEDMVRKIALEKK
jgi:hypothetical protein